MDEGEKREPVRVKKFLDGILDFVPENELDRRLLLGIVERS